MPRFVGICLALLFGTGTALAQSYPPSGDYSGGGGDYDSGEPTLLLPDGYNHPDQSEHGYGSSEVAPVPDVYAPDSAPEDEGLDEGYDGGH
jgi:hypothetical protein